MRDSSGPCFHASQAYVGVGSNLGDRLATIAEAVSRLAEAPGVASVVSAPIYETLPVGPAGPGNFYNTVLAVEVCLTPVQLLHLLQSVEISLGRLAAPPGAPIGTRLGARLIDLDLLFYEDLVFQSDELSIPHPYAHRREFVMRPLADLAPSYVHPELGVTMRELLAMLPASDQVIGIVARLPASVAEV